MYYGQSAEAINMHVYTCFRDSIKKDVYQNSTKHVHSLSSNALLTFWVIENWRPIRQIKFPPNFLVIWYSKRYVLRPCSVFGE